MIRAALVLMVVAHAGVAVAGHTCHEVSPVIGHRRCGSFGSRWAHSATLSMGFEPSLTMERITLSPSEAAAGTAYSATSSTGYHQQLAPGSELHPIAFGGRMRVGYHGPWLTLAVEYGFGVFADGPKVETTLDTGATQTTHGGDFLDVAGVIGVHRRWDRITLGGEVAVGSRVIYLQGALPDGYTTCTGGTSGRDCIGVISDRRLLVETAASLEVWLGRRVTLVITAGYDVAGSGEVLAVGLAAHGEPYDGD